MEIKKLSDYKYWFVDEIDYYDTGWYIVRLVPNMKPMDLIPLHLRYVLVPASLLETAFLKTKSELDPNNQLGRNTIKQGSYYEIERNELWTFERYYKSYCYIEKKEVDEVIYDEKNEYKDGEKANYLIRDIESYTDRIEWLFSNEITPSDKNYPYKSESIEFYHNYYNSLLDAKKKGVIGELDNRCVDKNLYIICLNVGQGDTSVIILPNKKAYIIDFNFYKKNEKNFEIIYNKIKELYNIEYIEGVFITHKHIDHIRGLSSLIRNEYITIKNFYYNNDYVHDLEAFSYLESEIKNKGINIINVNDVGIIDNGRVKLEVINPTSLNNNKKNCPDINDSSIVLKLAYDDAEFFFTGDAGYNILNKCCNVERKTRFLKVSHHGSITGTDASLADKINPKYAFISVGEKNQYHHPSNYVVELFNDVDISYKSNDVVYITDGRKVNKMSVNLSYNSK